MARLRTGYKRLYNSIGCRLPSEQPIHLKLPLGNSELQVVVGQEPPYGIQAATGGKYYVLGQSGSLGRMSFGRKDVSESAEIGLLTEISILRETEVDDALAADFNRGDPAAVQKVLEQAESRANSFRDDLDMVAGTIGLLYHRQFVIELLAENAVAVRDDGAPSQTFHGHAVEVLEQIGLNDKAPASMETLIREVAAAGYEAKALGASALGWLLRSWRESDPFAKFMGLFIPLEVVLTVVKYEEHELAAQRALDTQIENVLRTNGGHGADVLVAEYRKLRQLVHPPLAEKFESLAKAAQIDGWQADIEAFRRFNRIRNGILHRGEKSIEMSVPVGDEMEKEVRTLEDLAERYVLWVLFRSKEPYKTRYRPKRR